MMTIGSLLLGVALLIVVGLYVARPLLSTAPAPRSSAVMGTHKALQAQKEAIVARIRELDFDHETGKVPDGEYEHLRADLVQEAAHVLQQLDNLEPAVPAMVGNGTKGRSDDDIEAAVASRRARPAALGDVDAAIEAAVARVRQADMAPTATKTRERQAAERFCARCGQPRAADDRFCAYCGLQFK